MIRRLVVVVMLALGVVALAGPAGAASPSDRQLAQAGVLVTSDFPAGWTAGAGSTTSDDALDAAAAKVAACRPFVAFSAANKKNPRAKSKNFADQQSNVTDTVSVYPSSAKATAAVRTFSDARIPGCLEQLFRREFEKQLATSTQAGHIKSVAVSISKVPGVRIGDQAVAYQGPVQVALDDGTSQRINLGIAAVRAGKAVAGYSWTSDVDISTTLQPAIVKSVARLHAAQSAG